MIKYEGCSKRTAYYAPPPHRRCGGYIVLQMSVGRSVCRSVGLSVGRSTKCCPDDNSRTLGPRIMKLHRELGYDEQRKPIVFEVSRLKVKVTRTWKHKMLSG